MKEIVDFLATMPLFQGFEVSELEMVAAFLGRRHLAAGELVFHEGDTGRELFMVRTGMVVSSVNQADGSRRQVYEFGPGRFFGEMAIVERTARSATCQTTVDSELLSLEDGDFFRLIFEHPLLGLKILSGIGRTMAAWLDESSRFLGDLVRWGEVARRRVVEDTFTGLFNRRFLEESLVSRFATLHEGGRGFCLLMMDLDHFRQINFKYGTAGGDQTIKAVATAVQAIMRANDSAAHLAGDEFAFLLPDTDMEQALAVGERICRSIEALQLHLVPIDGGAAIAVSLTASLGVALAPVHGDNPERLMASADQGLYRAEEAGRNGVAPAQPLTEPAVIPSPR